ncbi:valine--tRNA ligase [Rhodobaculum claviforme]|uniref:Valine--tRNA ligase n=1 Tax=Rhodobaculum claviforme TaxID=1549854 RepID=A0A934TJE5_9RHOB|nr:valine--tRNA ligase [Rhodobaculum claviforme]MBK5927184.1 valine--tRNA ligase [Rhodobaculum claviforme]
MAMDKTFQPAEAEARISATWDAANAFAAGAAARRPETFCIMIPPPNVTGSLHMGHAFNNTLQDILVRWHRMRGFDTLWQPGQDHAGIATQMVVERELAKAGKRRSDFTREEFVAKVWEWKAQSGGTIVRQLQRLGASCDWSRNAFTMSGAPGAPTGEEGNFHDAVIRVFVELYNQGAIYRGKRLVNWDPHFETAISDLEVEQTEVDGHLWRLRYPLADGATYEHPVEWDEEGRATAWETRDYLVVATTRPETMLGDTGIAVHPDDARYAHLVGKEAILPLVGRRLKIVADSYADPEKGTGAVKMTPAHDFNDWEVGQRTGLRAINVMDRRAAIALRDNPDFAAGCDAGAVAVCIEAFDAHDRYEVRDALVETARAEGWLDGIDPDRHVVPHGDRSKVAVEPFLTDQWFVDTKKIVDPALDAVREGRTRILPEQHEKVYFHWLENIEPWCISRQLWWGHQIPVWYGPNPMNSSAPPHELEWDFDDPVAFCAATFEDAAKLADQYYKSRGLASQGFVELPDFSETGDVADWVKLVPLIRDPDVLDTWFSSGLWPIGTLGWPEDTDELKKYFPTDVLVTGFDIIFFWVARMMMMQLAVVEKEPFHTVYVHALVRDEKGKKMSKSLGNVLDPLDLIDDYGADAVRFTLTSMAAMGRDLKLSKDRIAGYRNFGTKLWNACRFAEMNGVWEGHATQTTPPQATATANRWILGETGRIRAEVDAALTAYRFNDAANALYAFVWGRVCDWYVEFAKPLLADPDTAGETRATMAFVLDRCMILLHPFMPFVTEELWSLTGRRDSLLVHAEWPEGLDEALVDPQAEREMRWVITLIEEIRSARAQMRVPAGAYLEMWEIDADDAARAALARNAALIARLARIEAKGAAATAPRGALSVALEGASFALPLQGVIDIAAETARLGKTLAKLEKEAGGLRGRLSNPKFTASAPPEVVEEARDNLAQVDEEAARLREALRRLEEMA